jgi:hypothetical protein
VEGLESELARLQAKGAQITMPLTCEEWGERAFQVRDPNGVIIQLADWTAPTGTRQPTMTCSSASPARPKEGIRA